MDSCNSRDGVAVEIEGKSDIFQRLSDIEKKAVYNLVKKLITMLTSYCTQLPVLGYNSSRYDVCLVRKQLFTQNSLENNKKHFVIKKNNGYTCISTPTLKFLDASNYLAAGTSYDSFLKSYDTDVKKSFFPYEWLDEYCKLQYPDLPPYDAFYSKLKKCNTLEAESNAYHSLLVKFNNDVEKTLSILKLSKPPKTGLEHYAELQEIWLANNWTSVRDLLIYYNNCDVSPFVEALLNMLSIYQDKQIDLFKNCVTVPSAARHLIFNSVDDDVKFALCDESQKDIHTLFKQNICGGPSIVMTRYQERNVTKIRGNKSTQKIAGFDCNALYAWCILQDMPTGHFRVRREENMFQLDDPPRWQGARDWLSWMAHDTGMNIETAYNGKEHSVLTYKLDGFCRNTKTILSYHGCWWHGCFCQIKKAKTDQVRELLQARQERTISRTNTLRSLGYTVIEMYECVWMSMKRDNFDVRTFIQSENSMIFDLSTSTSDIIDLVKNNKFFGAVECDLKIPDSWTHNDITPFDYFSEFAPIFRTCSVDMSDIGEHMKTFMKENNISSKPRKTLVAGMYAEKILLATPLLKFYIDHGLVISHVYKVIEFEPKKCFEKFVNDVADDRRKADKGLIPLIQGDTSKLIGNSAYGSMLLDPSKHRNMRYAFNSETVSQQVNQPTFRHFTKLDIDFFELEHAKKQTVFNMPIQLGFFVLQYAKLRMLDFYYNCVDYYLHRSDFQYCSMDTDSAYFSLSADSFESLVRSDKLLHYNLVKNSCDKIDYIPTLDNPHRWFPRTCCDEHAKFDSRTPGLFKLEYEGNGIVALCSKMYCVKSNSSVKFSCKGISKSNIDKNTVYDLYLDVLKTRKIESGVNIGIRLINNKMTTYKQTRAGFTYFYYKRRVLDDGISTLPLDMCLK